MPILKFPAIILQTYDTGETSEAVRVFSGAVGRLSVMAKGIRAPKSRFAGIIQPLATVELTLSWREGAEMATLREAAVIRDRHELHGDMERVALAALLAEIAAESCDAGQESPEMFAVLEHALDALDPRAGQPAPTAALHYLLRILAIAGYEPHIEPVLLGGWPAQRPRPRVFLLDVHEGRVHLADPQPSQEPAWPIRMADNARDLPIPPEAVRALYANQRTGNIDLADLPRLESAHANAFIEALVRLAQYHIGHQIKSARFWRSL